MGVVTLIALGLCLPHQWEAKVEQEEAEKKEEEEERRGEGLKSYCPLQRHTSSDPRPFIMPQLLKIPPLLSMNGLGTKPLASRSMEDI